MRFVNYIKNFWKSVVWAILIVLLSTMDTGDIGKPDFLNIPHLDKLVHFCLYSAFTFLLTIDFKKIIITGDSLYQVFFIAFTAASIFGGAMELVQLYSGFHRSASLEDFFANMAGSITAVILFRPLKKFIIITLGIDESE